MPIDPFGPPHDWLLTEGDLWKGTKLRPVSAGQPTKIHYPADLMGCLWKHQPTSMQEMTPRKPPGTLFKWSPPRGISRPK